MPTTPKPKNLRRLRLRIEDPIPRPFDDPVPDRPEDLPAYLGKVIGAMREQHAFSQSLIRTLNEHHVRIEEAFADNAGHNGAVGLNSNLDLQGHVVINSGKVKNKKALATQEQVDASASFAVGQAVNLIGGIDITELLGADELFDLDIPGQVEDLTLEWVRKVGWLARVSPPINVKRTLGYFFSFFNDTAGVVWMGATTGQVVASQALSESNLVDATHFSTNLSVADLAEPFLTTGVKVRVVALVKIKGKGKVRGVSRDYSALVPPGGEPGLAGSAFTGTAVPELPMGFERADTGGTTGNTTTEYYLDAAASAVVNRYVGTTERHFFLYIPSLATADQVRRITAYDSVTKKVTVTPAWSGAPGDSLAFEIHRGLVTGGKSGTGHGTGSLVGDSGDSAVNDYYNGMMMFIPEAAAGQQLQKITDYVGATKTYTIEPAPDHVALAGAPANNCGYLVSKGGFGYAASNKTGIIAPVPFRIWLDTEPVPDQNVVEPIPPDDANSYWLTKGYCQAVKKSNGKIRYEKKGDPDEVHRIDGQTTYVPMVRMRWRNLFREGGSEGWSEYSYYAPAYITTETPTVYEPTDYPAIEIDYQEIFPV